MDDFGNTNYLPKKFHEIWMDFIKNSIWFINFNKQMWWFWYGATPLWFPYWLFGQALYVGNFHRWSCIQCQFPIKHVKIFIIFLFLDENETASMLWSATEEDRILARSQLYMMVLIQIILFYLRSCTVFSHSLGMIYLEAYIKITSLLINVSNT